MSHDEARQEWEVRIAAYQSSKQSATEWCAIHQLQPRQLWYWLRKFKITKNKVSPTSQWVTLEMEKPFKDNNDCLLVRIGTAVIEVKPGYNSTLLSDVVRTLQTLC